MPLQLKAFIIIMPFGMILMIWRVCYYPAWV